MNNFLNLLQHFSWINYFKIILVFVIASIALYLLSKRIFKKRSIIHYAISTSFCMIFIYATIIVSYSTLIFEFESTPLPFISVQRSNVQLISYQAADLFKICNEILHLIILAFWVNIFDTFLPQGKNPLTWFLLRCVSAASSYIGYSVIIRSLQHHLPNIIVLYAPALLLGILLLLLFTGFLKIPVGALLSTGNPIMGALYTFFIANIIGKQITRAIITSGILGVLLLLLQSFGVTEVTLNPIALLPYLPFAAFTVIIWYLAYKLL